ncbi:type I 3-dehydroquinate dehydratase [Bacillaceae bacterium Marseille-Q3522]|nr:type I 3-dehydroquinate dehydratase [Bacillaceae bacterium Marseille-Q3522]
MSDTVKIRGIAIGEGIPKICVPIVGNTLEQLKEEALTVTDLDIDIIEWRADFFEHIEDQKETIAALSEIRKLIGDIPLLFTFRSTKEGGNKELGTPAYLKLNKAVISSGLADMIDVELFNDEKLVKEIIAFAHDNDIAVIISNHDFQQTPAKEEIISRLQKALDLGADFPKIAVMPNNAADVLTLLQATNIMKEKYPKKPFITISMGGTGVISRMAGEVFGSALTFAAAKKASAPGQIAVAELRKILAALHNCIENS